jgi:hypothetical protein
MYCNKSKHYLCRLEGLISRDSLTVRISETHDLTHTVASFIFLASPFINKTFFIYEKDYRFY